METLTDITVIDPGHSRTVHHQGWYEPPLVAIYLPSNVQVRDTLGIQANGHMWAWAKCVGRIGRHVVVFHERGLERVDQGALDAIRDAVHWEDLDHNMWPF